MDNIMVNIPKSNIVSILPFVPSKHFPVIKCMTQLNVNLFCIEKV